MLRTLTDYVRTVKAIPLRGASVSTQLGAIGAMVLLLVTGPTAATPLLRKRLD